MLKSIEFIKCRNFYLGNSFTKIFGNKEMYLTMQESQRIFLLWIQNDCKKQSCSVNFSILWEPEFHYRVHKRSSLDPHPMMKTPAFCHRKSCFCFSFLVSSMCGNIWGGQLFCCHSTPTSALQHLHPPMILATTMCQPPLPGLTPPNQRIDTTNES